MRRRRGGAGILCSNMNRDRQPRGTDKRRWTLRRLADLILRVVRLCTAFQLSTSRGIGPRSTSRTISKGQSSRRQPSLLELSQPDSWDQLNRDIKQRMQYTHPQHLPSIRNTASYVNSRQKAQDVSEVNKEHQPLLSKAVRDTLSRPPWTRTHEQVEQAVQDLRACTDFQDYPVSLQRSLCKVGWYLSLGQGRVVFKEHYPATSFYFLLCGSVLMSSEQEQAHTLTAGASFGDQAIVEESNRTMTCSTENQVELFVISKSDFLDLSLRQARINYQRTKHFAFCKSVNVLKHWPIHLLEAHPDKCKVAQFRPNTVVVKDSRRNPWVFIVMTGSCRVVKRFVYGDGDKTNSHNRKKSVPNPNESPIKPELASEEVPIRQPAATGTLMMQRQLASSPRRKNKHPLSQGAAQDLLQRKGKGRPKHRLPHTISTPVISERQLHIQPPSKRQFLVQLQLLQPKDIFGLSSFVHPDEPSVTLVSNGAEVVMLSKDFLLQHFSETLKSKLKRQITQFPSQEAMLKRIREHHLWNVYKQSTVSQSRRQT